MRGWNRRSAEEASTPWHVARATRIVLVAIAALLGGILLREGLKPAPNLAALQAHQDTLVTSFRAPLVTSRLDDTTTRSLRDYRGKVVLVDYWATWCAPCGVALSDLAKLQSDYQDTDLRIVAVSIDAASDRAAIRQEMARRNLTFDVLHDSARHAQDIFGVWGVPMSFLIDRSGHVRARTYGIRPDGVTSHWAWPEARVLIDSLLKEAEVPQPTAHAAVEGNGT